MSGARIAWTCLAVVAAAVPVRGELVVMTDGRFLKAESVTVDDERAVVRLPSGGVLEIPMLRIDRVVEDEVGGATADPLEAPALTLAFEEEQGVPETPFGQLIFDNAKLYHINPGVVAAIVQVESAFDPRAESHKGARGLMQLMPATGKRLGRQPQELFDPELNVEAGVRYLAELARRYDQDLGLMLAAYNAGEGIVDRYNGIPPFRETRDYIRRIYSLLGVSPSPPPAVAGGR